MTGFGIVHIVDDDEATRDSLRFLLAASGLPARVHASALAFLEGIATAEDGCVITDVRMPDINGLDLLARVTAARPGMPVVVTTGHGDIALAVEAMKRGAVDFLEKPYADEAIVAAVQSALDRRPDKTSIAERSAVADRVEALSPRERQVLAGVVAGKANKVIAQDLDISPRTVEVYRANLMTKMQASSLSHLVRLALLAGVGNEAPSARV